VSLLVFSPYFQQKHLTVNACIRAGILFSIRIIVARSREDHREILIFNLLRFLISQIRKASPALPQMKEHASSVFFHTL
jgi:hypothetical protein